MNWKHKIVLLLMLSGDKHRGNSRERREEHMFFYEKGTHKGHCMVENRTGSLDLADLIPNVTGTILIESFHKHSSSF